MAAVGRGTVNFLRKSLPMPGDKKDNLFPRGIEIFVLVVTLPLLLETGRERENVPGRTIPTLLIVSSAKRL